MSKSDTWFGYLNAGEHSSPVVRDSSLESKNPKTIYLFNYARGKFLEYSMEVVEPKLRDLQPDDVPLPELKKAYKTARRTFLADQPPVRRVTISTGCTKPAGANIETEMPAVQKDAIVDSYVDDDSDDVLVAT